MNQKLEIDLPNELLAYKDRIESTIKPFIEIKAKAADNLRLWQSKFGGLPYFPKDHQYPRALLHKSSHKKISPYPNPIDEFRV